MLSNRIPPIISGWLPSAPKPSSGSGSSSSSKPTSGTSTPQPSSSTSAEPFYSVGHAFVRTPPIEPFSIPSPLFKSTTTSTSTSTNANANAKASGSVSKSKSTPNSRSPSPPNGNTDVNRQTPALEIRELGYGIFYPIDKSAKSLVPRHKNKNSVNWVPEPEGGIVDGYEKFLGPRGMKWLISALRLVVGRMKMPVTPFAPLVPPPTTISTITAKHPLVIFSHGLAGTRNTYSQYCAALASRGYVVLAIEHRDGSGPAVSVPDSVGSSSTSTGIDTTVGTDGKEQLGKLRTRLYTKTEDLEWTDGKRHTLEEFRTLQLDMRIREVYEVFHSFRRLVTAAPSTATVTVSESHRIILEGLGPDESSKLAWIETFAGKVNCDEVDLTGHSFGGGTMMHLLQTPPPESLAATLPRLPVKKCIALDPWLEPLPLPAPDTPSQPDVPLLVINSPGFTVWGDHFRRLLKQVKVAKGSLITLLGSNHQSFSDFPLLAPGSPAFASSLLSTVHDLSLAFLSGSLASAEALKGKNPDGGECARGEDGKGMAGKKGDVVVHLLDGRGQA